MSYQDILYEVEDGIATVTLNRPDKLNAWTRLMAEEVRDALVSAGNDEAVRVIVITGAGRGFCAGADMNLLSSIQEGGEGDKAEAVSEPATGNLHVSDDFRQQVSYFPTIEKPVIAAINGACAGLGLVMCLYADIRYAADSARFTTAFAKRGLIAEHGISWMLPRLVGLSNALDLLYSSRMVDADEALRIGLVSRVFPTQDLMAEVRNYARMLANDVSPRSLKVMKEQVYNALFQDLKGAIETGNEEMEKSFKSEDFKEGVAHFLEKRPARFSGK